MMKKTFLRITSTLLSLVLLCQLLPVRIFATELTAEADSVASKPSGAVETVVAEVTENRTEYSKDFKLSSGFHLAALYPEAVHYQKDGQWLEIDNTLKLSGTGANARYTNTAGIWQVSFPQQLGSDEAVTVTRDGKSLSFRMTGSLRQGDHVVASTQAESFALASAQVSAAQVQTVDLAAEKASAKHPETVYEKGYSRLRYGDVFSGTHVVYDLQGNRIKESVVMEQYDAQLRGFRFLLETDGLTPVLSEDGQILLYGSGRDDVVMVMPAPFLLDSANIRCADVTVTLTPAEDGWLLSYLLPADWLAEEERQWPVILDPVVNPALTSGNIKDATVSSNGSQEDHLDGSIECGWDEEHAITRFFLKYNSIPNLKSSDVVVNAEISLYKCLTSASDREVTVHRLHKTWESTTVTWANYFGAGSATSTYHDTKPTDFQTIRAEGRYVWDITDIVRGWYESSNTGMLFKSPIETNNTPIMGQFYSSDYSMYPEFMPTLFIVYRNNNGLEDYWDFTTAPAGRAGTGYINNYTGNLVWVRSDLGFGGNRMPVSISHIYNANDAAKNNFGLGYGWRTNYNQLVSPVSANNTSASYVWEDGDGTSHYFYDAGNGTYVDEDNLQLTFTASGSGATKYCIQDEAGNRSYFDTSGRLRSIQNNQATPSSITVTYAAPDSKQISQITDGVGRNYVFTYDSSNLLTKLTYQGSGSTEISSVSYGYTGSDLTSVTDKDEKTTQYTYSANHHLATARDIDGYLLTVGYTTTAADKPARVASVVESHNNTPGGSLTVEYAHNQTVFTDVSGNRQLIQFNDWGNTVSIQDGEGRAQYAGYAYMELEDETENTDDTKRANQIRSASRMQNTVGNVLKYSSFEGGNDWTAVSATVTRTGTAAYIGSYGLSVTRSSSTTPSGVKSPSFTVPGGATYTFSAYVKTGTGASAHLALTDGGTPKTSQTLPANSGWTRLEVSYTNTGTGNKTVTAQLLLDTTGTAYLDCVQVEKAPTASRFNLVENGDFTYGITRWSGNGTAEPQANATANVPQLSTQGCSLTGAFASTRRQAQTVNVSGSEGDTFVLSGWAKADSVPLYGNRKFGIIATFYNNGTQVGSSVYLPFNPDANSTVAWQYAATALMAPGTYDSIKIELAYDYNANTAFFDGIQLYKEAFGSTYTYDDDGNVKEIVDVQGGKTEITTDSVTQNITSIELPDGSTTTYNYDTHHNIIKATTASGVVYDLTYDTYGNNTTVKIGGSIEASTTYSGNGNYPATATDTVGNVTRYSYNTNTGVLEWVQYPNDTSTARTSYTYDDLYRMVSATSVTTNNVSLTASYTYENDLLKTLVTGSTTYTFNYGNFGLRSSIQIGSNTLASYSYTDRTHYLSTLSYENDDSVTYTYDQQGRVTRQTYEDGDTVSYSYDNNGALATVTDSATGRTATYYYDFTDRLMKYVESGTGHNLSLEYTYDVENLLTELVETVNGVDRTSEYLYDKDNRVSEVQHTTQIGDSTYLLGEAYFYDTYGRLDGRWTEGGFYTYYYKQNTSGKPTTQIEEYEIWLVNTEVVLEYTYDANGNIASVSDGTNTTYYTYDSLNQLIREDNEAANKTWVWTYDDSGNILSRTEYAFTQGAVSGNTAVNYTYGNSSWGDLLTKYGSAVISYDEIGNMTSDGTWAYTWEHGRQLAAMSKSGASWSFTYDANGMRTKRTSGSTTYNYTYSGSQLAQMTVGGNTLYFYYDSLGNPMQIIYNGADYGVVTNLQGDVVALIDEDYEIVVQYTYDAWGKLLSTTGSMASTLGVLNPLRYRGYVYDRETGLYYLQSRYYNPAIGRFINADAFAATGQGVLGNNMYAYCNNNPVNGCDPCGSCFHRLDFWNDCEKCGGRTVRDKWNSFTAWCEDAYTTINDSYIHQQEVQNQILVEQMNMRQAAVKQILYHNSCVNQVQNAILREQVQVLQHGASAVYGAYMRGLNIQQEASRLQSQATINGVKQIIAHPEEGADLLIATSSTAGATYVLASAAVFGNPVSVPIIGSLAVAGYGLYRAIKAFAALA